MVFLLLLFFLLLCVGKIALVVCWGGVVSVCSLSICVFVFLLVVCVFVCFFLCYLFLWSLFVCFFDLCFFDLCLFVCLFVRLHSCLEGFWCCSVIIESVLVVFLVVFIDVSTPRSRMVTPPLPTPRMVTPALPHTPRPRSRIYRRFVTSNRPPAGTPPLLKRKSVKPIIFHPRAGGPGRIRASDLKAPCLVVQRAAKRPFAPP